jgi:hypothetical protein
MANHVYTSVTFDGLTPDTVKKLEEKFKSVDFGDTVGDFIDDDIADDRERFTEAVGAKWCNLEDKDFSEETGYAYVNLCSAWSYPEEFVVLLNNYIVELQEEDFTCQVQYDDEMPNFAGAQFYKNGELFDGYEEAWEDIFEAMKENYSEICELIEKLDDGEELTEEEQEKLYDLRTEAVYDTIDVERQRFFSENTGE